MVQHDAVNGARQTMLTGLWPLTAGVAYECRATISPTSGQWQFYGGPEHLQVFGKAWVR